MALYVERVPLTSERKASKVWRICEQHQLKEQGVLYIDILMIWFDQIIRHPLRFDAVPSELSP